jgi:hypothetical protein
MEIGILFLLLIGWQIYKAAARSQAAQAEEAKKAPPLGKSAPPAKNSFNDRLSSLSQRAGFSAMPTFDQRNAHTRSPAYEKEDYFSIARRRPEQRRDRPHKHDDPEKTGLFEVRPRLFH